MYKKSIKKVFAPALIVLFITIIAVAEFLSFKKRLASSTPTPSQIPILSVDAPSAEFTKSWKTINYDIPPDIIGKISFLYPPTWSVIHESPRSGGAPDYVLEEPGTKNCIAIYLSSEGNVTLENDFDNFVTHWDSSQDTGKILARTTLNIDNKNAEIRTINLKDNTFRDGLILLGVDRRPEIKESNVFLYANTCGLDEVSVFDQVIQSVKLNN